MSIEINKSNYEEFYLDFLEGNLSGEVLLAFEQFLAENPELAIEDDLIVLQPEAEAYGSFDKLLLKKQVDISELNESSIDYFLISSTEGLLSEKDQAILNSWLDKNPAFKRDAALVAATKSEADLSIVYEDKEALKHKTRIIPMWWSGVAAAAAILLLFVTFTWNTGRIDETITPVAQSEDQKEDPVTNNQDEDQQIPAVTEHQQLNNSGKHVKQKNVPVSPAVKDNKKTSGKVDELQIRRADFQTKQVQLAEASVPAAKVETLPQAEASTYVSVDKMANPAKAVTKVISETLDTPVDFRTAKANKKKGGGFYLKLGKLEVSHTTAMR